MVRTLSLCPWYRLHDPSHTLSGKYRCGNGAGRCNGNKYTHFQGINSSLGPFIFMKNFRRKDKEEEEEEESLFKADAVS